MKKFRAFIDVRKEEEWLNKMLHKGWLCKKVTPFGIYHFEKTKKRDQVIRLDFQSFKSADKYQQYTLLHKDYGWQSIGGSRWSSAHYWLKSTDGLDELFSDNTSEQAYLQRLMKYYGSFTLLFVLFTMNLWNNSFEYTNLKSAYFTPGLWDKDGTEFIFAFLFETPFALLRLGSPWFIIFCGTAFAITYLKYKKELTKTA
jgi:ABC-type uncharacterized transport system fused permease/ATPase subunit